MSLVSTRLYYTDSHLTNFEAHVTESGVFDDRPFVVLDQSAFYPTTGGQPHDTGTLSDRRVVDVIEREADGAVLHVLDAPLVVGVKVSGRVDWARRLDHMQQHTGQHVLSASFVRLFEIPTVSFHLGTELSTIDLTGTPGPERHRTRGRRSQSGGVAEPACVDSLRRRRRGRDAAAA